MRAVLLITAALLMVACEPPQEPRQAATASIDALQGQWVVINYWARWCKPCVKEIPELNELDHRHADVTVLGVNYDGATGDDLAAQVAEFSVKFANLEADPAAQLGIPRPVVLPTTIVLDKTGVVVDTLIGPQTLASLEAATVGRASK
ncbi:MAG: TlpA disulfide reductase family protein [Halieaceae bacterium]